MRSIWLSDYTWPELDRLIGREVDTLLLMLGATEQHGPHLPMSTDTLIGEALAAAVAARLGRTLAAPVVPLGTSDEHMDFAGTLSLSKATLAGLIADVGRAAARHGFARLVVLSAHGGNYDAIRLGVELLRRDTPEIEIVALTGLTEALRVSRGEEGDVPDSVAGLHAGERETSELLHLRPDLARMEHAKPGYTGDMRAILPRLIRVGLRPVADDGVLGDPRPATAERGARYLERQAEALAHAIRKRMERDDHA
jgi:creatinine amidohydrolase